MGLSSVPARTPPTPSLAAAVAAFPEPCRSAASFTAPVDRHACKGSTGAAGESVGGGVSGHVVSTAAASNRGAASLTDGRSRGLAGGTLPSGANGSHRAAAVARLCHARAHAAELRERLKASEMKRNEILLALQQREDELFELHGVSACLSVESAAVDHGFDRSPSPSSQVRRENPIVGSARRRRRSPIAGGCGNNVGVPVGMTRSLSRENILATQESAAAAAATSAAVAANVAASPRPTATTLLAELRASREAQRSAVRGASAAIAEALDCFSTTQAALVRAAAEAGPYLAVTPLSSQFQLATSPLQGRR
eukprot:TRINITY_DN46390_c0_g1_i1.p1 TRINITY_DN46390_c0_g1~~TRINITY_DN46390_c0_g1_i1.p1  ORF type:complete len:311 (+),score=47.23 TRINITY_DN46390_c0_g1_i1:66-998(+)